MSSSSSSTTSTPLGSNYFKAGPIQPPWYQNHPKGHESDCNFTPSPVEPHPKSLLYGERPSRMFGTLPSDQESPILNTGAPLKPAGMFNPKYSHALDDSSSSAGSLYIQQRWIFLRPATARILETGFQTPSAILGPPGGPFGFCRWFYVSHRRSARIKKLI